MSDLIPCKYVVVRFHPSQERDEFLNVGVILHAQDADGRLEGRFGDHQWRGSRRGRLGW